MDDGRLVPDDLVNSLVADRLAEPDTQHGYILDGFPRTLNQAEVAGWSTCCLYAAGSRREHRRT